ncbi:hypothetical protein VB005_02375 [Metarhizium brunneum]
MELEMKYPGYGKRLLDEFSPGPLMDWETRWWKLPSDGPKQEEMIEQKFMEISPNSLCIWVGLETDWRIMVLTHFAVDGAGAGAMNRLLLPAPVRSTHMRCLAPSSRMMGFGS